MKTLRALVFWFHLVVGLLCSGVVLSMALSGVLLVYESQVQDWLDTRACRRSPDPQARLLGVQELAERLQAAEGSLPATLTISADPGAPVVAVLGRDRTLFLERSTGQVLGEGSPGARAFFRSLTAWHRWLGGQGSWRAVGKAVTGASTLGLLFLLASGFVLWCPRRWTPRVLRELLWFRSGLPPRGRDLNQHHVLGFWALAPLLVIALSGVVIAYSWANSAFYGLFGEEVPARRGAERTAAGAGPLSLEGLDDLFAHAQEAQPGWRTITVQFPASDEAPVTFTLASGGAGQPQRRSTLTLSRTGEVREWAPFSSQSPGRRWRAILRYAHTGEVAGFPGQTLAGLAALAAGWLAWTGLALTWRRYRCWRHRPQRECPED